MLLNKKQISLDLNLTKNTNTGLSLNEYMGASLLLAAPYTQTPSVLTKNTNTPTQHKEAADFNESAM